MYDNMYNNVFLYFKAVYNFKYLLFVKINET